MTFHIITIFPDLFKPYLNESILGRGVVGKKMKVQIYDLRKFAKNKHNKVDDQPYGGGPGMVFKIEPIAVVLEKILKGKDKKKTLVVLMSAGGKQFDAKKAKDTSSRYKEIVILAARYEGFDERTKDIVSKGLGFKVQELSVGPYVLTGGELPALIVVDAISRHIKGVLGKEESLEENRYGSGLPSYTRPEEFRFKGKRYGVPKVLLSGDHKKIDQWRRKKVKD